MRVLVTGASGFLGSALARALSDRHEVFGTTRGARMPPGITPLQADLSTAFDMTAWPQFDAIVHLAQSPRHAQFPEAACEVFAIAAGATQLLLDHAVRSGARRFVFASTGGLYAGQSAPFRESDPVSLIGPLSHYFASKRSGELLVEAYADRLEATSTRIFFCYGGAQRLPMLVPRLVQRIRDGQPITLQGDAGPLMNPVYIDDAVAAFTALVERGGPALVNIGGPRAVSLRDMCDALGRGLGRDVGYETDPSAVPPFLVSDIALMRTKVSAPVVDPLDGMAETARSLMTPDG